MCIHVVWGSHHSMQSRFVIPACAEVTKSSDCLADSFNSQQQLLLDVLIASNVEV